MKTKNQEIKIVLDDTIHNQFQAVWDHVIKTVPGIRPSAADILRFAINRAAESVEQKLDLNNPDWRY